MKVRDMHRFMEKRGVKNLKKLTPEKRVRKFFELMSMEPANKNADSIYYSRNVNASGMVAYLLPNRLREPEKMLKAMRDSYSRRGSCIFIKESVPAAFDKSVRGAIKTSSGKRVVQSAIEHPNRDIGFATRASVDKIHGLLNEPDPLAEKRYKGLKGRKLGSIKISGKDIPNVSKVYEDMLHSNNKIDQTTATYLIGNNRRLLTDHAEKIIKNLGEDDLYVRNAAEVVILDNPWVAKKYAKEIAKNLDHPSHEIRASSASAIGAHPDAVELYSKEIEHLLKDKSKGVTMAAASSIGKHPKTVINMINNSPERISEMEIIDLCNMAKSLEGFRGKSKHSKEATQALRMLKREVFKIN